MGDAVARSPPEIYVGGPGGVPHAEAVAAGRLDAAADQAAERAGLRFAEDALAEKVVALQVARERSWAEHPPGGDVVVCPFMRLAACESEDAAYPPGASGSWRRWSGGRRAHR